MLALSMTITALPVQLLSCLTGKSGVVNADGEVQSVELGANAEFTSVSDALPVKLYYNYSFSEQIYKAEELGNISEISAIGFKVSTASNKDAIGDVYLLNTDKTSFDNTDDTVSIDDATLVYSGTMKTTRTGWMYLKLDQSFTRETTDNLMVIVINKTGSFTYNYAKFDTYYEASKCVLYRYTDSGEVKPGDTLGNAYTDSYKNIMRLYSSTAISTYQLTYDRNDNTGETFAESVSALGAHVSDEQHFEREGYYLVGWNTDPEGNGIHYNPGDPIDLTGDLTLYAEWVASKTITYIANDGSENSSTQDFNPSKEVKLAGEVFTRDGYFFVGWNTDPEGNGTHYNAEASISLTEDMTLYAEWVATKSITYKANDGTTASSEQEFDPSKEVKLASDIFTRDGFTLIGWNTASNGSGTVYACNEFLTLDSDLTLYAMWKNESRTIIAGDFESSAYLPVNGRYNYGFTEQIYTPKEIGGCPEIEAIAFHLESEMSSPRKGKQYLLDTTLTEMSPSDEEGILDNADLVFDGTFPFADTGWSVIPFDHSYQHDPAKNLLVILIDETGSNNANAVFSIYSAGSVSCTRYCFSDYGSVEPGIDGSSTYGSKSVLKIYPADGYSYVTLNSNGSDERDVIYVASDESAFTLPENPFTRSGFKFAGWNTQEDGLGIAYDDYETISFSGDLVLYAQWQESENVTYYANNGSGESYIQDLNLNTNEITGNHFFYAHYLFAGWNTQADGQGDSYVPGQVIGSESSFELYAQWDYAVYYDFSSDPEDDGWIFIDSDGDGNNWRHGLVSEKGMKSHSGEENDKTIIFSESYSNDQLTALNPDNWAIAPSGVVDPNGAKTVSLWAIGQDVNYPFETFALYAAKVEDVDPTDINLTKWTQISPVYTATDGWVEYTGDLSNFSGQNVYVAIRHFGVTDQFILNIDDVTLPFLMPDDELGANLAGYTVSLDGDIAVNFYMELDQSILNSATAKMVFTIPNGSKIDTQTIMVSDVADKPVEIDGKTYYIFKCKVAAKDMTGKITAQIVDTDRVGEVYTYSVKEYASYILSAEEGKYDAKTIRLVKALLNYGASAQKYFNVNTGDLANSELSDDEKILSGVTADLINKPYDPAGTTLPDGVSFEGATLSLKSETTLSLYFKSDAKLTFSCGSRVVQRSTKDGYQIARIRGINAAELDTDLELTVTVNGENYKVTYNPMTYCYNVISDDSYGEDAQNFCRALYLFHKAFMAYLGVQ